MNANDAVELLHVALFAVDETIDGLVADNRLTLFEFEPTGVCSGDLPMAMS